MQPSAPPLEPGGPAISNPVNSPSVQPTPLQLPHGNAVGNGAKVLTAAGMPTHGLSCPHSHAIPLVLVEGDRGFQAHFALGKSVSIIPDVLSCPLRVWKQSPVDTLRELSGD